MPFNTISSSGQEVTLAPGSSSATTENSAVGTTSHFNSSVSTGTDVTYPAAAGNFINSVLIHNVGAVDMGVSFDGGANFKTIIAGEAFFWTCQAVKQFKLTGNTTFEIVVNFSGVS